MNKHKTLVPAEHLARLTLQQLLDFQACPFRYHQTWLMDRVKKMPWPDLPHLVRLRLTCWEAWKSLLRSLQQTGKPARDEDIHQVVWEACKGHSYQDPHPDWVTAVLKPVAGWYRMHKDITPMAVDEVFQVSVCPPERESPRWKLQGRLDLIFKSARFNAPQACILWVDDRDWTSADLISNLVLPFYTLGVQQGLNLDIPVIHFHLVDLDGNVRVMAPQLTAQDLDRFLVTAQGIRAGVEALLPTRNWYPNRAAGDCRSSTCKLSSVCLADYGGELKP